MLVNPADSVGVVSQALLEQLAAEAPRKERSGPSASRRATGGDGPYTSRLLVETDIRHV